MVPFDVVDGVARQYRAHCVEHIVAGIRIGKVENQLVPLQFRQPRSGLHDPFRMPSEQVRIRIDHLRFEPQSELHALGMHESDQLVEAFGPYIPVDPPIAESGGIRAP